MIINSSVWKKILSLRTKKHRIVLTYDKRQSHVNDAVAQLIRNGYMVWLDRVWLDRDILVPNDIVHDIYLLTPKGVKLCDENSIRVRE